LRNQLALSARATCACVQVCQLRSVLAVDANTRRVRADEVCQW
jgi:hypothetical protein